MDGRPEGTTASGGTRPGPPPDAALQAMAAAARRAQAARAAGGGAPASVPPEDVGERRLVSRSTVAGPVPPPMPRDARTPPPPLRRPVTRQPAPRRRTGLVAAVLGGATVILAGGIALGLALRSAPPTGAHATSARRGGHHAGAPGSSSAPAHTHHASATPGTAPASHTNASSTTTSAPAATTTTTAPGTPGGPQITAMQPGAGGPGTSVTVSGSRLFSTNGQIVAYFAGTAAPTSCPSTSTCTITVPALSHAAGPVPLTIVTASGTSNAVSFEYR